MRAEIIRLGIIGCGSVVQERHLPALGRVRGLRTVAVADVDANRAKRVAEQFGIPHHYSAYSSLLESKEVDAVAVCVPPQSHAEVARASLAAGKHVLIEKPLALSLSECDLLQDCAARYGALKVMVGFNMRWHRLMVAAQDAVSRGELGDIKLVRTVFTSGVRLRADFADWRMQPETGGGALFELGMHHFDLLRFLLGSEAQEVYAMSAPEGETATVAMSMECGAQVLSAFSESTGENHTIEVYGERGWLHICCYRADGFERFSLGEYTGSVATRLRRLKRSLLDAPRMIRQSRLGGDYVAAYAEEWRHFVDAIRLDSPVKCGLHDGRRALEIALAAREAVAVKQAVRLRDKPAANVAAASTYSY
jgi:predicted dehydrogenase